MIEDTLKQHQPGEKPRFFLHDEMKAWLCDNLKFKMHPFVNQCYNQELSRKLGINDSLPGAITIEFTASIADELIIHSGRTISLESFERAFQCISNVSEQCMIQIQQLQVENQELRRRLDLIENPLPL